MKISRRQHITVLLSTVVLFASLLTFVQVPIVKSLDNPHWWYGFIDYEDNSNVSNTTVTLTDVDQNNNSMTTTTDAYGFYAADLSQIASSADGDYIVVNCTNNSQVGENASTIDIGLAYQWCNLTGGTRLQDQSLSINVTPWDWDAGSIDYGSWSNTSNTYFNLTNQGNVKINVKIHGYNISYGGNYWNLTSSVGVNNYTLKYQESGAKAWNAINLSNVSFVADLQFNSDYFSYVYWQEFGLNLSMPTSSSPLPSGSLETSVRFWSELA